MPVLYKEVGSGIGIIWECFRREAQCHDQMPAKFLQSHAGHDALAGLCISFPAMKGGHLHTTHAKDARLTCGFCPVISFPSATTNGPQSSPCVAKDQDIRYLAGYGLMTTQDTTARWCSADAIVSSHLLVDSTALLEAVFQQEWYLLLASLCFSAGHGSI